MVYSIEEIKEKVVPIAEKYRLRSVSLFGSYAKGLATDNSDIDLLVDIASSAVKDFFDLDEMKDQLSESLGKPVDITTQGALDRLVRLEKSVSFVSSVMAEKVNLYRHPYNPER